MQGDLGVFETFSPRTLEDRLWKTWSWKLEFGSKTSLSWVFPSHRSWSQVSGWLERIVFEITCTVLMGTLNLSHSLTLELGLSTSLVSGRWDRLLSTDWS